MSTEKSYEKSLSQNHIKLIAEYFQSDNTLDINYVIANIISTREEKIYGVIDYFFSSCVSSFIKDQSIQNIAEIQSSKINILFDAIDKVELSNRAFNVYANEYCAKKLVGFHAFTVSILGIPTGVSKINKLHENLGTDQEQMGIVNRALRQTLIIHEPFISDEVIVYSETPIVRVLLIKSFIDVSRTLRNDLLVPREASNRLFERFEGMNWIENEYVIDDEPFEIFKEAISICSELIDGCSKVENFGQITLASSLIANLILLYQDTSYYRLFDSTDMQRLRGKILNATLSYGQPNMRTLEWLKSRFSFTVAKDALWITDKNGIDKLLHNYQTKVEKTEDHRRDERKAIRREQIYTKDMNIISNALDLLGEFRW